MNEQKKRKSPTKEKLYEWVMGEICFHYLTKPTPELEKRYLRAVDEYIALRRERGDESNGWDLNGLEQMLKSALENKNQARVW